MTPERRAELRALAMQAVAADYIEVIALLDALDLADARERRLREALQLAMDDTPGWYDAARAALSEVAPDA